MTGTLLPATLPNVPGTRRYAFHEGKLFIEDFRKTLMLNPWPNPWAKVRGNHSERWENTVPDFPVVQPVRRRARRRSRQLELELDLKPEPTPAEKRRIAFACFRAKLPRPVARAVEPFRALQWQHLVACAMSDRYVELIESNPALGHLWLLANDWHLNPLRVDHAATSPQRKLLEELDLPSSKSAVKFLRKCYAPALGYEMVEGLRAILANESQFARLRHLRRIGAGVVALGSSADLLLCCTPSLLEEVSACKEELYRAPSALRLENHLEMCHQLDRPVERPFRSRSEFLVAHRDLIHDYQLHQRQKPAGDSSFGLPPLVGTQTIRPLTTLEELQQEGREQDNCVASYVGRVSSGSHYIYKVTWPERCTLSIVRGADGMWRRAELEKARNRPAHPKTCVAVDAWIDRSQKMLAAAKAAPNPR